MQLKNLFTLASLALSALAQGPKWERLDKDNALLLILDLQTGLYGVARDFDPALYSHNMIAHSAIGKLFDMPVIMSTSAQGVAGLTVDGVGALGCTED